MNELIQELKQDLKEIKKQYAIYNKDYFWRYEYKASRSFSFTHVYCKQCNILTDRFDKKTIDCFRKGHRTLNLEESERSF